LSEAQIVLTDAPTDADRLVISSGLSDYTHQKAGYRDNRPLAALVKDPVTSETIGGMYGRTSYGLLFVDLVFLPDDLRGQDLGSRLLAAMESEAIARGCTAGFLLTITLQAPGFYAKRGWEEFGRIATDPPGIARVFFRKSFHMGRDGGS
jgi:GNAT superfamily N-acetyltransferase